MDEVDEGCRAISWLEWHDGGGPFDRVNPLECQLLLACKGNRKLMIAHWRIKHPPPNCVAKLIKYRGVATRDQVCYDTSDTVERDVINSGATDKVLNVANMLLMGLGRE